MLERIGRVGAAIGVLVATLTVWNALEYQRVVGFFPPYPSTEANNAGHGVTAEDLGLDPSVFSGAVLSGDPNKVWRSKVKSHSPKYTEREVLILGFGLSAWLPFHRASE